MRSSSPDLGPAAIPDYLSMDTLNLVGGYDKPAAYYANAGGGRYTFTVTGKFTETVYG